MSLADNRRGEMEISSDTEEVELKKIVSDINALGKEVELGRKAEQEQVITEAVLVLEWILIEEKTSLDQKKVELIVEKKKKSIYQKM